MEVASLQKVKGYQIQLEIDEINTNDYDLGNKTKYNIHDIQKMIINEIEDIGFNHNHNNDFIFRSTF